MKSWVNHKLTLRYVSPTGHLKHTCILFVSTPSSREGPTSFLNRYSMRISQCPHPTSRPVADDKKGLKQRRETQNCEFKPNSQLGQPPENQGSGLIKLISRLTSLTGGNFFLHSIDRDRRSVCMFSSNFFTASGLLVDIFFDVFGRNLKKLQMIKKMQERSRPPPIHNGSVIR